MAYVIAEPCIGTKDTACVDACPVDCIHPKKNTTYDDGRPTFDTVPQLYIDPVECIDCGACVPVCPVSAIFALDDLPEKWKQFTDLNESYVKAGKFTPEEFGKHQPKSSWPLFLEMRCPAARSVMTRMSNPVDIRPASRKRGNNQRGPVPRLPVLPTKFEEVARNLHLTKEMYTSSHELRLWCIENRNRVYIPEWLLGEWRITVEPTNSDVT